MTGLPPFMKTLGILMILVATMIPGLLFAGGKKSPTLTIRLHGEGTASDGSSFSSEIQLNNPPMKIFMRNVPVTSERDIEAFFPFPGRDGQAGAYFRLDAHGANKLQQFTVEDKGRIAIVLINGRIVANMKINAAVNDGILYVPGGIQPEEILLLQKQFPRIGSESEFGKKTRPPAKEETRP